MATKYVWGERSGYPIPAGVVGEIAEAIEHAEGLCPPGSLVQVARDPRSPLHAVFGWRGGPGAQAQRLEMARRLLRDLRVTGEHSSTLRVAFVYATFEGAGARSGYVSVPAARDNPIIRVQVWRDALQQLNGLQRRYQEVTATDLKDVWAAVDQATTRFAVSSTRAQLVHPPNAAASGGAGQSLTR